jgi:HAD superfamily hydrolase (TIGR01509 family)
VNQVAVEAEVAVMPYLAVVFDQDGTLINTFIPAMHAYSVTVGREITLVELEPVAHLGAARNLVSALLGHEATDAEDDVFHDALAEEVARIEPYPGIVELLRALRGAGVATAVATNSDARSAAVVLGAHGLDPLFDTVVTVDLVSGPKPNPEMIHLTLERLGLPADRVVFVGDSPGDMIAARAAGVLAVAAGWGHQTPGIPEGDIDLLASTPDDIARLVLGRR